MAKENVTKFEELLRSDEDLQAKLKAAADAAVEVKDEEEKFNVVIAPMAEENGLPFTFDELKEAIDEGLELSEDELRTLSGGEETAAICFLIGGSDGEDVSWDEEPLSGGACYYVGIVFADY